MNYKTMITDMLNVYVKYYSKHEDGRYFGYNRAINSIDENISEQDSKDEIIKMVNDGIYGIGPAISTKITDLLEGRVPHNYNEFVKEVSAEKVSANPHKHYQSRVQATQLLSSIINKFENNNVEYYLCGSYRREELIVGDIDILVIGNNLIKAKELIDECSTANYIISYQAVGEQKLKFEVHNITTNGIIEVDVRAIPKEQLGSMLLHFTGPREFNIRLRRDAIKHGWSLNEYGLHKLDGSEDFTSENEEDFFTKLGIEYISPENRS